MRMHSDHQRPCNIGRALAVAMQHADGRMPLHRIEFPASALMYVRIQVHRVKPWSTAPDTSTCAEMQQLCCIQLKTGTAYIASFVLNRCKEKQVFARYALFPFPVSSVFSLASVIFC